MITPVTIGNRPGLAALQYRVGTYADFRETMLARLSDRAVPFQPLNLLRTRSADDPAVALLDAFACVAEIVTFYQERLANEGFLRTATETQSVQELARLTGYQWRSGVASSVYLAFTLQSGSSVTLPAGARAQSVPGPGQTAQTFETSDALAASGAWNALQPRRTRPTQPATDMASLVVDGIATGLKPNDPLLLVIDGVPVPRRVSAIVADAERKRTSIALQPVAQVAAPQAVSLQPAAPKMAALKTAQAGAAAAPANDTLVQQAAALARIAAEPPARHPPNAQAMVRSASELFAPNAESSLTLAGGVSPAQRAAVFRSLSRATLAPATPFEVHAFRARTAPFGNRAPPAIATDAGGHVQPPQEWQLNGPTYGPATLFSIDIAASGGQSLRQFLAGIDRLADAGLSSRASAEIVSTITFGSASIEARLEAATGATGSGTLPGALGTVDMRLDRDTQTPPGWELVYTFSKQPLIISVRVAGTGDATVANLAQTDADIDLDIGETTGTLLPVIGSLRLVAAAQAFEASTTLHLDGTFDTITPGSWVMFAAPPDTSQPVPPPLKVVSADTVSRTAYGQTARTTRLGLSGAWIDPATGNFARSIRQTAVYADSVQLKPVGEDITDPVAQSAANPVLELNGLVTGLTAGKWLVVTGERTDLPGVTSQEVVMLAGAVHGGDAAGPAAQDAPGETPHTTLIFASPLAYTYRRQTVSVLGNIAPATQGDSTDEILGSGNGAMLNQSFVLKKPPLTHVVAATPTGSASTLRVWVNNIEWRETDTLAAAATDAKVFVTATGADGSVTVRFGDGVHGARLPTGAENIRAHYRSGLGQSGNLGPGTITTLLTKPLGVTGVANPTPASGGADSETPGDARANVPVGLVSLARLVAVADFRDFALGFAGIGKAAARRFAGPDGALLHLTVAGANDALIDPAGALWQALDDALARFGDPMLDVTLAPSAGRLVVIQAGVAVDVDRQWADVEPQLRAALLAALGFGARDLGQTLYVSEVVAAIQAVPGVSYVDLQVLASVAELADLDALRAALASGLVQDLVAHAARVDRSFTGRPRRLLPAELVYLSPALADMLVLNEITS